MRVVKPAWVSHDGKPIFSIDVHPDGSRFATGGQGYDCGKIVIWNMDPVRSEASEEDEKVPKMLCQMENHFACVNCVRWSKNGRYLASGGDDKLVMIFQASRGAGPSKVFGSSGSVVNVEQWRPVFTLRGHTGDVLDLSWSPHDVWLATCSVDNTVLIWNALKFPEQVATLKGHTGLVKGVTWDPLAKYIASQSDDRTLRVWRTMDWQEEAVVKEPFAECGGTTHGLRLGWSPDGHHIVSAHAMNNSGSTAQIIDRQGFKASLDFVGHRKAVTVVRFNPNIFSKKFKLQKAQQYSCCAIGSKDRSLSIWLTALKRPLVVMHDLFENSILDISWSNNGLEVMSCSIDGSVAFLDFRLEEIGIPLSQDEVMSLLGNIYGKGVALDAATAKGSQIIESAAMLNLQAQHKTQVQQTMSTPTKTSNSLMSASGDGTPFKPTDKQIETRTADGRRRITPIFLAPQPEVGEVLLPFPSHSNIEFHSSTEKSKIVVEKQNRVTAPGMLSPSSGSKSVPSPPHSATATPHSVASMPTVSVSLSQQVQSLRGINETTPEKQIHRQAQTSPVPVDRSKPETIPQDGADKAEKPTAVVSVEKEKVTKEGDAEKEKASPVLPKEKSTPSSSKEKIKSKLNGGLSLKRKFGDDHKKSTKRGRPSKTEIAAREAALAASEGASMPKVTLTPSATANLPGATAASQRESVSTPSVPDFQLPAMTLDKAVSKVIQGQFGEAKSLVLEVENDLELGLGKVHRLRCLRGGKLAWDQMVTSKVMAVAGSSQVACVACADGTVSLFAMGGRRLVPPLLSGAHPAILSCSGCFVMVITTKGMLYVWNCQTVKAEVKQEPVRTVVTGKDKMEDAYVTSEGVPIICLANKRSYTFSADIGCWVLACVGDSRLQSCSNHQACVPTKTRPMGTLASLQKNPRSAAYASGSFQSSPGIQQAATLSHLEHQIASCLVLKSASEYRFWMETYVRYLSQEGLEGKLKDVCADLLGPVFQSKTTKSWSKFVLGISKHSILRSVLPCIGSDLRFQRLYTEFKDQLDSLAS